ncbi:hypothetical protein D3C72_1510630 [compost metagenome]
MARRPLPHPTALQPRRPGQPVAPAEHPAVPLRLPWRALLRPAAVRHHRIRPLQRTTGLRPQRPGQQAAGAGTTDPQAGEGQRPAPAVGEARRHRPTGRRGGPRDQQPHRLRLLQPQDPHRLRQRPAAHRRRRGRRRQPGGAAAAQAQPGVRLHPQRRRGADPRIRGRHRTGQENHHRAQGLLPYRRRGVPRRRPAQGLRQHPEPGQQRAQVQGRGGARVRRAAPGGVHSLADQPSGDEPVDQCRPRHRELRPHHPAQRP